MKHNRKIASWAAAAAAVSFGLMPSAAPAQTSMPTSTDDWQYAAIIYGYFPQMGGSATFPAAGVSANITVDANKLISNLKFGFMGTLVAQKGPVGVFADIIYADVSGSKSATRDLNIRGITIPDGITANANLGVRSTLLTLAGSYRFVDTPAQFFDVLVGTRLIDLQQSLSYQLSADVPPFVGPNRQGSSNVSVTNWDAILGVKGRLFFGDRREWFAQYYLDAGTGQSQYTWQAIGGVGYHFSWGEVIAAWRYIDYRFVSNYGSSLSMNGPALGVEFHW
jgi:hypothetical protein